MKETDIGFRYGRLTVIGPAPSTKHGQRRVTCQCDCGRTVARIPSTLKDGGGKSCGCLRVEKSRAKATHGATRGKRPKEYLTWQHMLRRCLTATHKNWDRYGGRGISVCAQWQGPEGYATFLADMGPAPGSEYSIDRINNDGDYEPENCRWITASENSRRRHSKAVITPIGEFSSATEAAKTDGISKSAATQRARLQTHGYSYKSQPKRKTKCLTEQPNSSAS